MIRTRLFTAFQVPCFVFIWSPVAWKSPLSPAYQGEQIVSPWGARLTSCPIQTRMEEESDRTSVSSSHNTLTIKSLLLFSKTDWLWWKCKESEANFCKYNYFFTKSKNLNEFKWIKYSKCLVSFGISHQIHPKQKHLIIEILSKTNWFYP